MSEAFGLQHELELLHDEYVYRVNVLVAEGREDLATQLSDRFAEDALYLIQHSASTN
jgi:hypothetical protein